MKKHEEEYCRSEKPMQVEERARNKLFKINIYTKWRREPMQNMREFLVIALCDRE